MAHHKLKKYCNKRDVIYGRPPKWPKWPCLLTWSLSSTLSFLIWKNDSPFVSTFCSPSCCTDTDATPGVLTMSKIDSASMKCSIPILSPESLSLANAKTALIEFPPIEKKLSNKFGFSSDKSPMTDPIVDRICRAIVDKISGEVGNPVECNSSSV